MRRRGFLQSITLSTLAALLPWRDVSGWQVVGEAIAPGARLAVQLATHVPHGAVLTLAVHHQRLGGPRIPAYHRTHAVTAGQHLELVTPYPYADLVAGTYFVHLSLRDGRGRMLDQHEAGHYAIRRFRFSA